MEKVSIVTICYNSEKFIEATIRSVISQDYNNIDFVIIDGSSKDKTLEIIKKYQNAIDYWSSEPDNGIYDAMNKGVKHAKGEWIIFMNSSDCFASDDVVRNIFSSRHPSGVNVIYGDVINNYGDKREIKKSFRLHTIKYRMPFCHQAVFVRRDVLLSHPFDLMYKYSADYNLFYSLFFEKGEQDFLYLPITVALCDATESFSRNNMFSMWLEYMKIRSAHKDIRWYWDNIKNWIKINILRYK